MLHRFLACHTRLLHTAVWAGEQNQITCAAQAKGSEKPPWLSRWGKKDLICDVPRAGAIIGSIEPRGTIAAWQITQRHCTHKGSWRRGGSWVLGERCQPGLQRHASGDRPQVCDARVSPSSALTASREVCKSHRQPSAGPLVTISSGLGNWGCPGLKPDLQTFSASEGLYFTRTWSNPP